MPRGVRNWRLLPSFRVQVDSRVYVVAEEVGPGRPGRSLPNPADPSFFFSDLVGGFGGGGRYDQGYTTPNRQQGPSFLTPRRSVGTRPRADKRSHGFPTPFDLIFANVDTHGLILPLTDRRAHVLAEILFPHVDAEIPTRGSWAAEIICRNSKIPNFRTWGCEIRHT